jgi:uncharacterized membrane protein
VKAAKFFTGRALLAMGVLHVLVPKPFLRIMPAWLPAQKELVYASGVTEAATAITSWHPRTRRASRVLGIATMLGVFPANIDMALRAEQYPEIPPAALWARLPLQALFVYWIVKATSDRA